MSEGGRDEGREGGREGGEGGSLREGGTGGPTTAEPDDSDVSLASRY